MRPAVTQAKRLAPLWLIAAAGLVVGGALVIIFRPPRGEERTSWRGHAGPVWALALSHDGSVLASAGEDGWVRQWSLGGSRLAERQVSSRPLRGLAFSPTAQALATGGDDKKLVLLNASSLADDNVVAGHVDALTCLVFVPDGSAVLSGSRDKRIRSWSLSKKDTQVFKESKARIAALAISPDGQWLASGGDDGALTLWNVMDGEPAATLQGHKSRVCSVAFSPDGKRLASGGRGGDLRLWDLVSTREIALFKGHVGRIDAVAFLIDRPLLASGGEDRVLRFWSLAGGNEPIAHAGHANSITSMVVTPDSRLLVSADTDGRILVWDSPH